MNTPHICTPQAIDPDLLLELRQQEYAAREKAALDQQIADLEAAPLAERRAGREDWRRAMLTELPVIRERTAWLLQGQYGYGAMAEARRVLTAGHGTNYTARVGQLLAALEWQCAPSEARKAWRSIGDTIYASGHSMHDMVTSAIEKGIEDYRYAEEMEEAYPEEGQGY